MNVRARRRIGAFLALAVVMTSAGAQQTVADKSQREDLAKRRAAVHADAQAGRESCYQQFAVTACIERIEAQRREELDHIRRQEVALNDQERKARAAARVSAIESKSQKATDSSRPQGGSSSEREMAKRQQVAAREARARQRAAAQQKKVQDAQERQAKQAERARKPLSAPGAQGPAGTPGAGASAAKTSGRP